IHQPVYRYGERGPFSGPVFGGHDPGGNGRVVGRHQSKNKNKRLKSFFTDIFRRNIYLFVTAFVLFISGYFLNLYFSSDASVTVLRNSIQSFLQDRQNDFGRATNDTAFLHRLINEHYSQTELEKLIEK